MDRIGLRSMSRARQSQAQRPPKIAPNWHRYEALKAMLQAMATTPQEFEAAARKAARLAGV